MSSDTKRVMQEHFPWIPGVEGNPVAADVGYLISATGLLGVLVSVLASRNKPDPLWSWVFIGSLFTFFVALLAASTIALMDRRLREKEQKEREEAEWEALSKAKANASNLMYAIAAREWNIPLPSPYSVESEDSGTTKMVWNRAAYGHPRHYPHDQFDAYLSFLADVEEGLFEPFVTKIAAEIEESRRNRQAQEDEVEAKKQAEKQKVDRMKEKLISAARPKAESSEKKVLLRPVNQPLLRPHESPLYTSAIQNARTEEEVYVREGI